MLTSEDVLNPRLFRALRREFGRVRVSQVGDAMRGVVLVDRMTGQPKFRVEAWGEAYSVDCCFCADAGQSLAVNHMYGQRHQRGGLMTDAAFCREGECLVDPQKRQDLFARISRSAGDLKDAIIRRGRGAPPFPGPGAVPDSTTRIDDLQRGHPARRYLRRLGLDPDRVGRAYGVGYCDDGTEPVAGNKIVIPYEPRGWQALVVPAEGTPPIKFTNAPRMRISAAIYNVERACDYETVVIVPTPIDVWRLGPMALSLPGRKLHWKQWQSLSSISQSRTLVILGNADDLGRPDIGRLIKVFRFKSPRSFAVAELRGDRKRGTLSRVELRDLIVEAAANQGVKVTYED